MSIRALKAKIIIIANEKLKSKIRKYLEVIELWNAKQQSWKAVVVIKENWNLKIYLFWIQVIIITVDPVYSERVGAAKSVHLRRVFTINIFNLTIN